ncbi:hypothetical protein [Desulfurococcus mucosus]|uniref:Uncharacterized protein n=1 Tax=Desulfurococcus mucosus (strain ATCC 35584 / DSM 2162 / JCM 9187 / O7/1) TaxID=765177 RepID=E8R7Y0_DESM0|nr:hypothetical protein [Desulfurococcus mucosus]ADV64606.1 hypothetical protein Desmu_0287 [Desulfurococcus mucosus DSM 2162]
MSDLPGLTGLKYDSGSLDLLGDPVKEAELLLKGRYLEVLNVTLSDFVEALSTKLAKGSYLLSCRDESSYTILLEDGVVKSVAEYFPEASVRLSGYIALRDLVKKLASSYLECRLFSLQAPVEEPAGKKPAPEAVPRQVEPAATPRPATQEVKPPSVDEGKLHGFLRHLRDIVRETADLYGCILQDEPAADVGNGYLVVRIKLRKKGLFGKCRDAELKAAIEKDLPLLIELHELGVEVRLETLLVG